MNCFRATPQSVERRPYNSIRIQTRLRIHLFRTVMVLEHVRQCHGTNLEAAVQQSVMRQEMHHMGAEAARCAFLDGDQHFMFARQTADQVGVERLGKACIGDGG